VLDSGVKVLAYHGDRDWICNWEGGLGYTNNVEWEGKKEFNLAKVKDIGYGMMKEFKNFRFLKVYGAGHMVPMDKPKEALEMLEDFIGWNPINSVVLEDN